MEAYQERVVQEKKELDEKIVKLTAFVYSDKIHTLKLEDDQLLLFSQLEVMQQYSRVLRRRIQNF